MSTRRAHAKLRTASKQAILDSRKTARSETDEVDRSRKRTRLSIPPRRTPATTRSKAKDEAASTSAEPSLRPSAKNYVTPSARRVATPSTGQIVTPSQRPASTPLKFGAISSARRVVTPSTGQNAFVAPGP